MPQEQDSVRKSKEVAQHHRNAVDFIAV